MHGEFGITGIARFIAASGYGVYAIDHPGFGLSEGLHGYIYSFDELADNVIEQYAKIKGGKIVAGISLFCNQSSYILHFYIGVVNLRSCCDFALYY